MAIKNKDCVTTVQTSAKIPKTKHIRSPRIHIKQSNNNFTQINWKDNVCSKKHS